MQFITCTIDKYTYTHIHVQVSVESFRAIMEEVQAARHHLMEAQTLTQQQTAVTTAS